MRVNKIIKLVAGLAVVAVALAEFGNQTGMILAEEDCPCEVRETECCLPSWPSGNLVCFICYKHGCNGPGCAYTSCGPGYYETGGYCRPIGSPAPSAAPGGQGGCTIQTHKNLQVDWNYSATQVRFSWELAQPLRSQWVMVGDDYAEVAANCKSNELITSDCLVKDLNVPVAATQYLIDRARFDAGKIYWFKAAGGAIPACSGGDITQAMMSCNLQRPASPA